MKAKVKDPDTYRRDDETIAQHALRLLEKVPYDEWITDDYTNKKNKCCGVGHYMRLSSSDTSDYSLDNCSEFGDFDFKLRDDSYKFLGKRPLFDITRVNNTNTVGAYTQDHPKDRVLALLKDMIAAGY